MKPGSGTDFILIIDDDASMQSLLSDVLSTMGYRTQTFSNAVSALNFINTSGQRVGAIICDIHMPRVNGMDFLEMLGKTGKLIPVIMITAFGSEQIARVAKSKGAYGYLSKPFQLKDVEELVRRAVANG